jgi:hypothetical protein
MNQPLTVGPEEGSQVTFRRLSDGGVSLEAKGALAPTIEVIDFTPEEVAALQAWLGKAIAANRAESARLQTAPNSEKIKRA